MWAVILVVVVVVVFVIVCMVVADVADVADVVDAAENVLATRCCFLLNSLNSLTWDVSGFVRLFLILTKNKILKEKL